MFNVTADNVGWVVTLVGTVAGWLRAHFNSATKKELSLAIESLRADSIDNLTSCHKDIKQELLQSHNQLREDIQNLRGNIDGLAGTLGNQIFQLTDRLSRRREDK